MNIREKTTKAIQDWAREDGMGDSLIPKLVDRLISAGLIRQDGGVEEDPILDVNIVNLTKGGKLQEAEQAVYAYRNQWLKHLEDTRLLYAYKPVISIEELHGLILVSSTDRGEEGVWIEEKDYLGVARSIYHATKRRCSPDSQPEVAP